VTDRRGRIATSLHLLSRLATKRMTPLALWATLAAGPGCAIDSIAPNTGDPGDTDAESGETISSKAEALTSASTPMYELYSAGTTDHFYTTSAAERDYAISIGFGSQGVPFYVESSQVTGTLPLKRFYNGSKTEHFYTTSQGEVDYVLANGWVYEGFAGYIYASQVSGTLPLYRMNKFTATDGDHLWTTNYSTVQTMAAQGWAYDGVVGYVPDPAVPVAQPAQDDPLTTSFSGSTVSIRNQRTGVTHTYPNLVNCGGKREVGQADLNGDGGREVVIETTCSTQYAIDDARQRVYTWTSSTSAPVTPTTRLTIAEVDPGHAGKEIVAITKWSYYDCWAIISCTHIAGAYLSRVNLAATSTATSQSSLPLEGYPDFFLTPKDYDGSGGDEVILKDGFALSVYSGNTYGLYFRHRATFTSAESTFYPAPDTNNKAGDEVVVTTKDVYNTDLSKVPYNVHTWSPADNTLRSYGVNAAKVKTSFKDRDGIAGAEICYAVSTPGFSDPKAVTWYMIIDRTRQIVRHDPCGG